MIRVSADLCLVNGYGVNLNEFNWKDEKEIQRIIDDGQEYMDLNEHIENTAHDELQYVEINGEWYLYAPTVLPTLQHVEATKLWTEEDLATEIYRSIGAFIEDSKDDVQKKD